MFGLGSVDRTADSAKPTLPAAKSGLDLKASSPIVSASLVPKADLLTTYTKTDVDGKLTC